MRFSLGEIDDMIDMTCENHPHLSWLVKSMCVTPEGRYIKNVRRLHYMSEEPECSCSSDKLIAHSFLKNGLV